MGWIPGQQVALGVDRLGLDAARAQRREPLIEKRPRHHGHRRAAGVARALTDGEVQILDIVRQLLLERVGHELLELQTRLDRNLRLGEQHVRSGDDHPHPPSRGARCRRRQRAALERPHGRTARVHHQPGRRLVRDTRQAQQQPVSHRRILSWLRAGCPSVLANQSGVKLRRIGRTLASPPLS